MSSLYQEPIIIPPIQPDLAGHGVPSDHSGVLVLPDTNQRDKVKTTKIVKYVRPMPESSLLNFGKEFVQLKWNFLDSFSEPNDLSRQFEETMKFYVDKHFPLKKVTVSEYDKPYFTEELRALRRKRQRRYAKHGKDDKYRNLSEAFEEKLLSEKKKYRE